MKIIEAIYYLYYRFYRIIKSISLKTSYYQVRVIFFFSMVTGSNLATVTKVLNVEIENSKFFLIAGGLIWFFFWVLFFSRSKRLKNLFKRFETENKTHRIIGGIGVIIYSITSFIIFINVMTNST